MALRQLALISGILYFQHTVSISPKKCVNYMNSKNIQLMVNYTMWRNNKHLIILEESIKSGCNFNSFRSNLKIFSDNNIYLSLHSSTNTTELFLQQIKCRTTIVTFYKNQTKEEVTDQANKIAVHGEIISWLIIIVMPEKHILDHLRLANFALNADVVIAVGTLWARPEAHSQLDNPSINQRNTTNSTNNNEENCKVLAKEVDTFVPFAENVNATFHNLSSFCQSRTIMSTDAYCMLQIYKIRKCYDNSLVVYFLGIWDFSKHPVTRNPFLVIEKRDNFFKFPLTVGEKNTSESTTNENVIEDDDNEGYMKEFMTYFSVFLNSSEYIVTYSKLGSKNNEGEWSDLFGAIIKEEVDLGVDSIIKTKERWDDMAFTYDIMESRRCIYIQPHESNELRDIFLVPFDSRLVLCVVGTGMILAIVMTIVKKVLNYKRNTQTLNSGFTDSFIWCIGIFSQQGSIWKPRSSTEQIIIIVSLAFTLVIYNSYSAFITSVLSVKLTNIRTVEDLLNSDYEIGYAKNSQDEIYLRSMNVTQLNQIYLRGYLQNNISNVTEGLLKAAMGKYGFFASGHVARRELLTISNYKCRYDIAEIPIKYTSNYIAFPMSKRSPYRKLINLSIIKMYETGVYKYIHPLLAPPLQKCEKSVTYQSARLPDLMTAFGLLFLGIILGVVVAVGECFWKKRHQIYLSTRKNLLHKPPPRRYIFEKSTPTVIMP